jgi:hypothetical protein
MEKLMCGLNINKYVFAAGYKMMNIIAIFTFLGTVCHAQKGRVKPIVKKWIHFMGSINLKFPDDSTRTLKAADVDSPYYDYTTLKLPENYSDKGASVTLVYLAHSTGGGGIASSWAWNEFSIPDNLVENGYACFDVNGGPTI